MGCHVWFYEKRDDDTVEDIIQNAINVCERNPNCYEQSEIEKLKSKEISLMEILSYTDYTFIDDFLCLKMKEDGKIFLFRTFNYEDEPLHCLEDTIEHINKYYFQQLKLSFKIKRFFFLLKTKWNIFIAKWFKDTSLSYTNTHYNQNTIELSGTYDETIEKVKEFWSKYPNTIITFG